MWSCWNLWWWKTGGPHHSLELWWYWVIFVFSLDSIWKRNQDTAMKWLRGWSEWIKPFMDHFWNGMILRSLLGDNATLISPETPSKWKERQKNPRPCDSIPFKDEVCFLKGHFQGLREKEQEKWELFSKILVSFFAIYFLERPNKKTETDKCQSVFHVKDKKQYQRVNRTHSKHISTLSLTYTLLLWSEL